MDHAGGSVEIVLGLGGNVGEPLRAFHEALQGAAAWARVMAVSPVYRSEPLGPPQPRYWNMAALLEVRLPPLAVLERCHVLEGEAGRDRRHELRWGPRPLDLDLLLAGGIVCRGPRLELPHPGLLERPFALVPAADVAPGMVHPIAGMTLERLADRVRDGLERACAQVPGCWG